MPKQPIITDKLPADTTLSDPEPAQDAYRIFAALSDDERAKFLDLLVEHFGNVNPHRGAALKAVLSLNADCSSQRIAEELKEVARKLG